MLFNLGLMAPVGVLLDCVQEIIPKLSKVTGLPVLNEQGFVVGVISRKVNTGVLPGVHHACEMNTCIQWSSCLHE
jgi:hypothetical protein